MTIQSEMALLAAGSYWDIRNSGPRFDNDAPLPEGWVVVPGYDTSESGANAGSGFSARVYQNVATREIVISFAGTEFSFDSIAGISWPSAGLLADFFTGNVPLAQGRFAEQAMQAAELYQRVKADTALSDNITFTGHSLGGGLASVMAVWFDRPAYVFAAAPFQASADANQPTNTVVAYALQSVMQIVRSRLDNVDPSFASYNPATDFASRETNVQAWAIQGELLEANLGMFNWIEAGNGTPLFNDSAITLDEGNKHSIDLHIAGLLVTSFQTQAGRVPHALTVLMDKNLYGGDVLGNQQLIITKLVRNEVGVRGDAGQVLLAANGMLTHFTNDLQKLGTDISGLNEAAQKAIVAQGVEWYYWQGTDYAGQEFSTRSGTLLQYTTAMGANLPLAEDRASRYVKPWLNSVAMIHGDSSFPGFGTQQQWNVVTGTAAASGTALDIDKTQMFVGNAGNDVFNGGRRSDIFFGGGGSDSLTGGAGNDSLYGGQGNDTYVFSGAVRDSSMPSGMSLGDLASETDTIIDSDGNGRIVINGRESGTVLKVAPNVWEDDHGVRYTKVGSGSQTSLVITYGNKKIVVKNWGQNTSGSVSAPGYLGITLSETPKESAGVSITPYGELVPGTGGSDVIVATASHWLNEPAPRANYAVDGFSGHDVITSGAGDDLIGGGDGFDVIDSGGGNDFIMSALNTAFNSGVSYGAYDQAFGNWIPAPGGTALIRGQSWGVYHNGAVLVLPAANAQMIDGRSQDGDVVHAGDGADTVFSGNGADVIDLGSGNDLAWGYGGDDYIHGGSGNDRLIGDSFETGMGSPVELHGNDVLDGDAGDDELFGGAGDDLLIGGEGNDDVAGGTGDDELFGGSGIDYLWGDYSTYHSIGLLHGNDLLDGGEDDDVLVGGGGADQLYGGSGNDDLFGDDNAAKLSGLTHADDFLDGGDGNDYVEGSGWSDTLLGGSGDDYLVGDEQGNALASEFHGNDILYGGEGNDTLQGSGGNDSLFGGSGNDFIAGDNSLSSNSEGAYSGDDHLQGNEGNDTLVGGQGNDYLSGGIGDDFLYGQSGSDTLVSGEGIDYLDGGGGDDLYIISNSSGLTDIPDQLITTINDDAGVNSIEIVGASSLSRSGDSNSLYIEINGRRIALTNGLRGVVQYFHANGETVSAQQYIGSNLLDSVSVVANEYDDDDNPIVGNTVFGGAANDHLMSNGASSTVAGGQGNDLIRIRGSGNTVVFNRGDGRDTVWVQADGTLGHFSNTLRLGAGIEISDVVVSLNDAEHLQITFNSSPTDSIIVERRDGLKALGLDRIIFSNGGELNVMNSLSSNGYGFSQIVLGTNGDDFISGGSGRDTIDGGDGNDSLVGNASHDELMGGGGSDTLVGGAGFDILIGGLGDDTYLFGKGHGLDVIYSTPGGDSRANRLNEIEFDSSVLSSELLFSFDVLFGVGNDLRVSIANTEDRIVINNFFDSNGAETALNELQQIRFSDGMVWDRNTILEKLFTGTSAGDLIEDFSGGGNRLLGLAGNDTLRGGLNSTLIGGAGDDVLQNGSTYSFSAGHGADTILASSRPGNGVLEFSGGIRAADLQFSRRNVYDLVVFTGAQGDQILIESFFDSHVDPNSGSTWYAHDPLANEIFIKNEWKRNPLGSISMPDEGVVLDAAEIRALVLQGSSVGEWILGGNFDDLINGGAGDDYLSALSGNDTLSGGDGNDTLLGDGGYNEFHGGKGDDFISSEGGIIRFGRGDGIDSVAFGVSAGYGTNRIIFDYDLNPSDISVFQSADNPDGLVFSIRGSADRITIRNVVNHDGSFLENLIPRVEFSNGTVWDTPFILNQLNTVFSDVSHILTEGRVNLTLTGTSSIDGTGNTQNNLLVGNSGNNTLDGRMGADTMIGGSGHDIYLVDNAGDIVVESFVYGVDLVRAGVSYTLSAYVENLTLTGTTAINGTGNELNNVLTGNTGANLLDGGAGADTLVGGAGNDIYVVDTTSDIVTENLSEGVDQVQASVSYTLATNVENLTLTGSGAFNGTGNASNNVLTGNSGSNVLDGGVGADTMVGGAGNDTYLVDATTDVVTESLNEGVDLIQSSVTYTLATNVENLTLIGAAAINGTGNTLNNVLTGNSAANVLSGGAGSDTLVGDAGNDTYVVDATTDVVTENLNEGVDLVQASVTYTLGANVENLTLTGTAAINGTGNALNNTLTGNAGNNSLDGGAGNDTMAGGTGNDTYFVDSASDVITEAASAGTDTVVSSVSWTLGTNLENLTLAGTANINGTGNTVANRITGNAGNNVLSGGAGSDTMLGGAGNDTYVVDATTDVVTENLNEGVDLVQASVTYTLASNVEDLTLTGTTAINGTGNDLNNVLTGNSANNTLTGGAGNDLLDGGAGNDTMVGGTGDDTYVVNATGDVVTELAGAGTDTVRAGVTYTLGNNLENLTLTGTTALNGTGNTLNNVLTGNGAANTLSGGAGNDTLDGGSGADSLVGGAGNDTYWLGRGYGIDTITESDTTVGNTDVAQFQTGIAVDQLWFARSGNNLNVSIVGTNDRFTMTNWYLGNQHRVEQFQTSDGRRLMDSQVQNLVSAMAAFSPPPVGQTTLSASQSSALAPVIAANWQ